MVEPVKEHAPSRAETRREQRRELIISAAEEELRESGLAGLTLAAVGDRVGLSKAALYYYVDGKDSLLALVLGDALDTIRKEAAALAGPDAPPVVQLAAFARAHVRSAVERPSGPLIASSVHELAAHPDTAALLREHTAALLEIVDEAVARGELRAVDRSVAASAVFGTLNSLARTFVPGGSSSLDEVVDAALDLLLAGWRAGTPHSTDDHQER